LLDDEGLGPTSAADTIADYVRDVVSHSQLDAALSFDLMADPTQWTLVPRVFSAKTSSVGVSAVHVLLSQTPSIQDASYDSVAATVTLSPAHLALPWGALASQALYRSTSAATDSAATSIRETLGCPLFQRWVAVLPEVSAACDDACVAMSCDRALAALIAAAAPKLEALDTERPISTVEGDAELFDDVGDLVPERIAATALTGTWLSGSMTTDSDTFTGALSGEKNAP
jgi:hypothetical protein